MWWIYLQGIYHEMNLLVINLPHGEFTNYEFTDDEFTKNQLFFYF